MVNRPTATDPLDALNPELDGIIKNLEKVVVGKRNVMEHLITALLAGGHVLLDDVPGVGKTTIAKTLAESVDLTYRRIQCTPDLLPTDITGVTIFHPGTHQFEFQPGPVFAHLVLADEINRTSPRTQSALLEVMEEGQVTVDGVSHRLAQPFVVIATQNPIEYEGTFPLPESQLDRFLFRLNIGYPTVDEETTILARAEARESQPVPVVMDRGRLLELMAETRAVHVSQGIRRYMAEIAYATRHSARIYLGMSPRSTLALYRATQAWALLHSRDYVIPDDVIALAPTVVEHRLILSRSTAAPSPDMVHEVFSEILRSIPVPGPER
ncbi:AAA family ATPase [Sulfobacillus harzensis]|uniref:MoxR family ATPase n=1 Tax=Sulfobacillus harzensis TaxID=2729629 RepID=A0A7Y0L2N5_9FIRM|nr:MoxR family ATPase [Sulfobacillus harzensis]NMP22176.1 MoxR family ATPase [Sulfobacillus harzensis]